MDSKFATPWIPNLQSSQNSMHLLWFRGPGRFSSGRRSLARGCTTAGQHTGLGSRSVNDSILENETRPAEISGKLLYLDSYQTIERRTLSDQIAIHEISNGRCNHHGHAHASVVGHVADSPCSSRILLRFSKSWSESDSITIHQKSFLLWWNELCIQ